MTDQLELPFRRPLRLRLRETLGFVLHVANSSPGIDRHGFYAMKEQILRRFGTLCALDTQHIVKPCWGCDGRGRRPNRWGVPDVCGRCWGSGIFHERFVLLERWNLGGWIFHRPACDLPASTDRASVTIRGRIEHYSYGAWSKEAQCWLALLFDLDLFYSLMTTSYPCGWRWGPMGLLNKLLYYACKPSRIVRVIQWHQERHWREFAEDSHCPF